MAAVAAMNTIPGESEDIKKMVSSFKERRGVLTDLLKEIPGVKTNIPNGAFYLFPDFSYYFGKSDGETKIENLVE